MKTISIYSNVLLIMAIVLFLCLVLDFLALHDIKVDYVSKNVVDRFSTSLSVRQDYVSKTPMDKYSPGLSASLPAWTNTPGEWKLVQMSYYIKLLLIVLSIVFIGGIKASLLFKEHLRNNERLPGKAGA